MNIWHWAFPAVRKCAIPPFQAKFNCNILFSGPFLMNIWRQAFPATVKECAIPLHFKLNSTLTVLILRTFLYENLVLSLSSCKRVHIPLHFKLNLTLTVLILQTFPYKHWAPSLSFCLGCKASFPWVYKDKMCHVSSSLPQPTVMGKASTSKSQQVVKASTTSGQRMKANIVRNAKSEYHICFEPLLTTWLEYSDSKNCFNVWLLWLVSKIVREVR